MNNDDSFLELHWDSEYVPVPGCDDRRYRVNKKTGEVFTQTRIFVDDGAKIISLAQQEAYRSVKEESERKRLMRAALSELGRDYFFVDRLHDFSRLKNQTLARLIYLATYLPGGSKLGDNQLYLTRRRPMQKSDLSSVLGIKSRTARDAFLEDAKPYITVHDDGTIFLNQDVFIRGHLPKEYRELQRAFSAGIRNLYRSTPPSRHRLLGLVFKMIPYINVEYNILCENPEETELASIQPLSIKQFCAIAGYDYSEVYRLKEELSQVLFPVDGRLELFCSLVQSSPKNKQTRIFVNPHIMYCGSNYSRVEELGSFCIK